MRILRKWPPDGFGVDRLVALDQLGEIVCCQVAIDGCAPAFLQCCELGFEPVRIDPSTTSPYIWISRR